MEVGSTIDGDRVGYFLISTESLRLVRKRLPETKTNTESRVQHCGGIHMPATSVTGETHCTEPTCTDHSQNTTTGNGSQIGSIQRFSLIKKHPYPILDRRLRLRLSSAARVRREVGFGSRAVASHPNPSPLLPSHRRRPVKINNDIYPYVLDETSQAMTAEFSFNLIVQSVPLSGPQGKPFFAFHSARSY
ncbi:hypothetical protein J6590_054048 [Homalodisca vitripennis]|nr:hypothetical protein J6590_054048 [Homalodisca vitripennis]